MPLRREGIVVVVPTVSAVGLCVRVVLCAGAVGAFPFPGVRDDLVLFQVNFGMTSAFGKFAVGSMHCCCRCCLHCCCIHALESGLGCVVVVLRCPWRGGW